MVNKKKTNFEKELEILVEVKGSIAKLNELVRLILTSEDGNVSKLKVNSVDTIKSAIWKLDDFSKLVGLHYNFVEDIIIGFGILLSRKEDEADLLRDYRNIRYSSSYLVEVIDGLISELKKDKPRSENSLSRRSNAINKKVISLVGELVVSAKFSFETDIIYERKASL